MVGAGVVCGGAQIFRPESGAGPVRRVDVERRTDDGHIRAPRRQGGRRAHPVAVTERGKAKIGVLVGGFGSWWGGRHIRVGHSFERPVRQSIGQIEYRVVVVVTTGRRTTMRTHQTTLPIPRPAGSGPSTATARWVRAGAGGT